jgi:hypothetical protein
MNGNGNRHTDGGIPPIRVCFVHSLTPLGHQHVDTTLGYARLYDGTVAADYYRGMAQIESRFKLQGTPTQ